MSLSTFSDQSLVAPVVVDQDGSTRPWDLDRHSYPGVAWIDLLGGIHGRPECAEAARIVVEEASCWGMARTLAHVSGAGVWARAGCCACMKNRVARGDEPDSLENWTLFTRSHRLQAAFQGLYNTFYKSEPSGAVPSRMMGVRVVVTELRAEIERFDSEPSWQASALSHLLGELERMVALVAGALRELEPLERTLLALAGLGRSQAARGVEWRLPEVQLASHLSVARGELDVTSTIEYVANISEDGAVSKSALRDRAERALTRARAEVAAAVEELASSSELAPATSVVCVRGAGSGIPARLASDLAMLWERSLDRGEALHEGDAFLMRLPRATASLLAAVLEAPRREDPGMFDEVVADDAARELLSWVEHPVLVERLREEGAARTHLRMLASGEVHPDSPRRHTVVDGTPHALAALPGSWVAGVRGEGAPAR